MSHVREDTRRHGGKTVPFATRVGQIFSRLKEIAQKAAGRYADSLRLEAEIVAIIAEETRGEGPIFCGPRSEEVWSDVLEGKRRSLTGDVTRVFVSCRPSGQRAAERIVRLLAARLDLDVVSRTCRAAAEIHEAKAALTETGSALQAGLDRDLADGRLSREEAQKRVAAAIEHERQATEVRRRLEQIAGAARG